MRYLNETAATTSTPESTKASPPRETLSVLLNPDARVGVFFTCVVMNATISISNFT